MSRKKSPGKTPAVSPPNRGTGRPLPAGDENPGSRAARLIRTADYDAMKVRVLELEGRLEAAETVAPGVTAAAMRRVFAQEASRDVGSIEARLREWLVKDPKGFLAAIDEREADETGRAEKDARLASLETEISVLKSSTSSGPDGGTARAREVVVKLLAEFNELYPEE